jgi:hypothetical protein
MAKIQERPKLTSIQFFVGEHSTNISVGDVYEAVNVEALVKNADLVAPILEWVDKVPEPIRLQFFAVLTDNQQFCDELAKMLETE